MFRRNATLVIACLIFGVVATVAASWTCAIFGTQQGWGGIGPGTSVVERENWRLTIRRDVWGRRAFWTNTIGRFIEIEDDSPRENQIPDWIVLEGRESNQSRAFSLSGWPIPAMHCEPFRLTTRWEDESANTLANQETLFGFGGIETSIPNGRAGIIPVVFPLRIAWFAFVLNVLFYGGVPVVLFWSIRFTSHTRRLRRGACLGCGHLLGGAVVCPECGRPDRSVKSATAAG